mmetsp:Transcript_18276/g.32847  ORF Transcript_18276/g.32847 Transcript_18276/m.32847 type:complete len:428 (-) Transcript_18276:87-1370(-)|eukprot:CAMPEP_0204904396 /NCGR_PEP_ID=MMETSP1397-20131031/4843_1 /ASSEMBLY_ACC=CAM_ASM_000891 /TAXON_ID=49980 /ORGANISM="Climacostomum Climacostomum virens, Strain Stock W-24" /LENGTH=427 /DNA_ID=CAMNT_0052073187 /DNA_START=157 /DNA_END=1443 /DNA_ORIENTATION=+
MRCTQCGCEELEADSTRGDLTCVACGVVVEDSAIVSELNFSTQSVVGQFVSSTGRAIRTARGFTRDSSEVTQIRAQKEIQKIASGLNLPTYFAEAAQRIYSLAQHNHHFIQGRKTEQVAAVSLYIVCRREKSSHLLIDFADLIGENLFTLGKCYKMLVKLLHFKLPLIDPSLFIHRFCAKLDFREKSNEVAITAMKFLQRMKRDWISIGRRPTGLCGAAILIAAKFHGLKRSTQQIMQTVKVCNDTIRKRLEEFQNTPVARLTRIEFESINLESEELGETNPPSYRGFVNPLESQKALLGITDSELIPRLPIKCEPETDSISDLEDDEIQNCILSPEEALLKEILWTQLNADWIEKQRFKKTTVKDANPRKRKRKHSTEEALTAADALKMSNRLPSGMDYTALPDLLKTGGDYDYKPLIPSKRPRSM